MSRLRPRGWEAAPERRRSEAKGAAANRLRRLLAGAYSGAIPLSGSHRLSGGLTRIGKPL